MHFPLLSFGIDISPSSQKLEDIVYEFSYFLYVTYTKIQYTTTFYELFHTITLASPCHRVSSVYKMNYLVIKLVTCYYRHYPNISIYSYYPV